MGRLSEEECLLRQAKNKSSINLNDQGNLLGSFNDKDVPQKHTIKKETLRKISKGFYYYCIKCITATFLAAFMSRRSLNSATLATTTHRRPEGVSDRTSTQVATQMIDKCRMKRVQEGLHNRKDPP